MVWRRRIVFIMSSYLYGATSVSEASPLEDNFRYFSAAAVSWSSSFLMAALSSCAFVALPIVLYKDVWCVVGVVMEFVIDKKNLFSGLG